MKKNILDKITYKLLDIFFSCFENKFRHFKYFLSSDNIPIIDVFYFKNIEKIKFEDVYLFYMANNNTDISIYEFSFLLYNEKVVLNVYKKHNVFKYNIEYYIDSDLSPHLVIY